MVGTGYTYLQDYLPHVAQAVVRSGWIDSVGLGRMVLSYPELPADTLRGAAWARKRVCRTFSDCTTAPRQGLVSGCYPLDPVLQGAARSGDAQICQTGSRLTLRLFGSNPLSGSPQHSSARHFRLRSDNRR